MGKKRTGKSEGMPENDKQGYTKPVWKFPELKILDRTIPEEVLPKARSYDEREWENAEKTR